MTLRNGGTGMPRQAPRVRRLGVVVMMLVMVTLLSSAAAGERAKRRAGEASVPPPIESAILMEAATGAILFEKDMHKQRAPASMAKMMLMLILVEKLRAGELQLSDPITVTAPASTMGSPHVPRRAG